MAFNRMLLMGILTTFQTVIVCGHIMFGVGAFCVLFHTYPLKLVAIIAVTPSALCAAFMDAYPEDGRAVTSRVFFTLNLIALLTLQAGIAFELMRVDDVQITLVDGWLVRTSTLASCAIGNLVPFVLRNLAASILRPKTLAVRDSDVVCVHIDEHVACVLQSVHAYLVGVEPLGSTQFVSSTIRAIGVVIAAM
jgi:hypothetical protein